MIKEHNLYKNISKGNKNVLISSDKNVSILRNVQNISHNIRNN